MERRSGLRRSPSRGSLALILAAALVVGLIPSPLARGSARAEPVTLDLEILVEGAVDVAAFEVGLTFDSDVISPTLVTLGDFVPAGSRLLPTDFEPEGHLALGGYNIAGRTANGDGTLAVVSFDVLSAGDDRLRIDPERTGAQDTIGATTAGRITVRVVASETLWLPLLQRNYMEP